MFLLASETAQHVGHFGAPPLSGHVRQAFLREVIASVLILSFKAFIFYSFRSVQRCVLLASLVYRVCICVLKRSSKEQRASLTTRQWMQLWWGRIFTRNDIHCWSWRVRIVLSRYWSGVVWWWRSLWWTSLHCVCVLWGFVNFRTAILVLVEVVRHREVWYSGTGYELLWCRDWWFSLAFTTVFNWLVVVLWPVVL